MQLHEGFFRLVVFNIVLEVSQEINLEIPEESAVENLVIDILLHVKAEVFRRKYALQSHSPLIERGRLLLTMRGETGFRNKAATLSLGIASSLRDSLVTDLPLGGGRFLLSHKFLLLCKVFHVLHEAVLHFARTPIPNMGGRTFFLQPGACDFLLQKSLVMLDLVQQISLFLLAQQHSLLIVHQKSAFLGGGCHVVDISRNDCLFFLCFLSCWGT